MMVNKLREPKVSILLPVFNGDDVVLQAIHSVQNQTYTDWELIIINDGSTDNTENILRHECQSDARLKLLQYSERQGIVAALNWAIEAAQGALLARLDADDFAFPERIRKQRLFLQSHPETGLVSCCVAFGGNKQKQRGYAEYVEWTNSILTPQQISMNRFVESPLAHPSVMFRRELVQQFGCYREGPFPEDYELWLRWLESGVKMSKLPEVLLQWHDSPQRLSRTDPRYSVTAFYECKSFYLSKWLQQNNPHHPDVVVWGAGRTTRKRAEMLTRYGINISAYVDIDPNKIGQIVHKRPVLSEQQLPAPGECFVISYVASRGAREDIRQRLQKRGYEEGLHFIVAA